MLWFLRIARGAAGVCVGGEHPTSTAAALESSNERFDYRRSPIQVLISTLMATSGGPICTLSWHRCLRQTVIWDGISCNVLHFHLSAFDRGALSSENARRVDIPQEQLQEIYSMAIGDSALLASIDWY